tara:strand:- start:1314 stop:1829 length:516 start_codon:yes stop_codon:yes gene_type:complete
MTATATKPEAFTLPASIKNHFESAIKTEMVLTAFNTCNYLSETYVRQELPRRFELPVFCSGTYGNGWSPEGSARKLLAINLRTKVVNEAVEAQQAKAVKTLEKKINQGLKDGEIITDVELHVDDQNMISGTVSGKGFSLTVKSIWNYRYGENSANGILTVYAQTRVNRKEA